MIVGVDAKRIVRNGTGLGSYGRTLVNDLIRLGDSELTLRLYAPDEGREELRSQVIEGAEFCYPAATLRGGVSGLRKAWWRSRGIVDDLVRDGVEVYHGLSGELPTGLRRHGIRSVVTIHDLIFMRHPEYYHWWDAKIYEWKFRQALHEADRIIAISERTRQDILELGGEAYKDRINVIYQSFAPRFSTEVRQEKKAEVRARYKLPQRYVLSVGTIERRKNLALAAEAVELLPQDIAIQAIRPVAPEMHARFSATSRTYHYYIHTVKDPFRRAYSCELHYPLDFAKMNEAAALLLTYEDFGAFCKAHADVKTTLCRVTSAGWHQTSPTSWYFEITANRFLRNMVRAVVGTLIDVGRGRLSLDDFRKVVEGKRRPEAGESMPANALFLEDIKY